MQMNEIILTPPEMPEEPIRCSLCLHPADVLLEFHGGKLVCRRCLAELTSNEKVSMDDLAALLCAAVV